MPIGEMWRGRQGSQTDVNRVARVDGRDAGTGYMDEFCWIAYYDSVGLEV